MLTRKGLTKVGPFLLIYLCDNIVTRRPLLQETATKKSPPYLESSFASNLVEMPGVEPGTAGFVDRHCDLPSPKQIKCTSVITTKVKIFLN